VSNLQPPHNLRPQQPGRGGSTIMWALAVISPLVFLAIALTVITSCQPRSPTPVLSPTAPVFVSPTQPAYRPSITPTVPPLPTVLPPPTPIAASPSPVLPLAGTGTLCALRGGC
jgi:hypothetical protein